MPTALPSSSSSSYHSSSPSLSTDLALSPALQSYLRDCVQGRLQQDQAGCAIDWFRIQLYLQLGDAECTAALDHDLRTAALVGRSGLIAIFGQLAPGLSCHEALTRQLLLLQGCDAQLHLTSPCSASRPTHLQFGAHRYSVLTLHEHADSLHRVMPCPMLVFVPSPTAAPASPSAWAALPASAS